MGKTQTCMQLLMTVQWPLQRGGLDGSALYALAQPHSRVSRTSKYGQYVQF